MLEHGREGSWPMSEDTDFGVSRGVPSAESGTGSRFRYVMRVLLLSLIVVSLVLVGLVTFTFCNETFQPRLAHILENPEWKPFFQGSSDIRDALQSIDDGSMVFLVLPSPKAWNSFVSTVEDDARAVGWVLTADTEDDWEDRRYHIGGRAEKLVKRYSSMGGAEHVYFVRQRRPDEPTGFVTEVVELTLLEKKGAVLFVSFYR